MSLDTEQKILDAALEVFSENGYAGARTRIIAKRSGFTEMTLFRKFETKENLFNQVLTNNQERIINDSDSMLDLCKSKEPEDRFRTLIMGLVDLIDKNFDYVNIIVYEKDRIKNSITQTFVFHLGEYLETMFPQLKVNANVFAFMVLSFLYFITFNKKRGEDYFDIETAVEEFINYHSTCLSS